VLSPSDRDSFDYGGPRGLWLSYDAQRVDDTIEMGDSARDPATNRRKVTELTARRAVDP
jgi:hypothetical protein